MVDLNVDLREQFAYLLHTFERLLLLDGEHRGGNIAR